jgi:preprotein translocase subunit SecE
MKKFRWIILIVIIWTILMTLITKIIDLLLTINN